MKKITRHMIADYLQTVPGNPGGAVNALMGAGFSALDERPRARVEAITYVSDIGPSACVVGYENSFAFDTQLIADDSAVQYLYGIARDQKAGAEAETYYYRVELYGAADGSVYPARRFRVAVAVREVVGGGGEIVRVIGHLHQIGAFTAGTFDTQARAFTAAQA